MASSRSAPSRRRLRRVLVAAVATLAFVGCASDSDSDSETTGAPGTAGPDDTAGPDGTAGPGDTAAPGGTEAPSADALTVYSGRSEELVGPILEQFTEETGIEVAFRGGDSGELAAQLLTEGDASPADVFFSQDAGALGAVEQAGLLAPLPEELVSVVGEQFRSKNGQWVGVSGRVRVLVINPDLVRDPPTTIDELLDPQWKGKVGFAPTNASWQSFVTALRLTRGEDGAREWLEGFKAQEPVAYERNGAVRDAVDAGDVAIGLVNHYYVYEKIAAEGEENVKARNQFLAAGDPGGLINVAGVGILASSSKADSATRLVEFLLSETAQAYFAETTYEYPLRAGVAVAEGLPALDTLDPLEIDLADLSSIEATQELLSDVGLLTL
jgi:iron(III) transport system substrate-binding protein